MNDGLIKVSLAFTGPGWYFPSLVCNEIWYFPSVDPLARTSVGYPPIRLHDSLEYGAVIELNAALNKALGHPILVLIPPAS